MENLELIYKELVKMVLCEYNGFEKFTDTMDYIGEDDIYYAIMTGQHIDPTDRDYDNYNRLMEVKGILVKYAPDMGLISNIVDCELNVINSELLVLFCEKYECYKYWYLIIKDIFCRLYTNNIYDYYENEVDALEEIFDYYHKTIIPSNTPNQEQETQEPQTPTNPILPPELSTPEAMKYWKKAQKAGFVDEHYNFKNSNTQRAEFASMFGEVLGFDEEKEKWTHFQKLWNCKNMAQDHSKFKDLKNYIKNHNEIKKIFE